MSSHTTNTGVRLPNDLLGHIDRLIGEQNKLGRRPSRSRIIIDALRLALDAPEGRPNIIVEAMAHKRALSLGKLRVGK